MKNRGQFKPIHGMRFSSEYGIWHGIKARCCNPNTAEFERYGARGIVMCERWRKSFKHFFDDMGTRPSNLHSIDRIDPNGNYEPANCRWATNTEQSRNRGEWNVLVPIDGRFVTVAEWAEITGGNAFLVYNRLRAGWSPEQAISVPKDSTRGEKHVGMKRSPEARANMAAAQRRRFGSR
jgi:hypothetical protein